MPSRRVGALAITAARSAASVRRSWSGDTEIAGASDAEELYEKAKSAGAAESDEKKFDRAENYLLKARRYADVSEWDLEEG